MDQTITKSKSLWGCVEREDGEKEGWMGQTIGPLHVAVVTQRFRKHFWHQILFTSQYPPISIHNKVYALEVVIYYSEDKTKPHTRSHRNLIEV